MGALAGSPRHAAAQPALQVREGFSSVCFEYRIYLHLLGVSVSLSLGLSSFSFFISLPLRPSPALPLCLSALTLPFSLNLTLTNSHPIPSHHNSLTHRHHTSLHLSLPTACHMAYPPYVPAGRNNHSTRPSGVHPHRRPHGHLGHTVRGAAQPWGAVSPGGGGGAFGPVEGEWGRRRTREKKGGEE